MIIKGKSRAGPKVLGRYLENAEKNERVEVLEIRGTIADDLIGALREMDAYAEPTRCTKPLYHAQISPEPPHKLTREQIFEAVDALEEKLRLTGHARVIVIHEKNGREHIHPVWSRIDLDKMRAVSDSHNYRKHEETARDLERRFGHPRVQGAHAERDGERPERTPSRAEIRQEERTGIKGADIREEVTGLFRSSDNAEAFKAALEDHGYILAQGDRRDFVIVDRAGGVHSLGRRIEGMRAAELRAFLKPIDRASLPTASSAHETQIDRQQGYATAHDERRWEEETLAAALRAEQRDREEKAANREALRWDDELHAFVGRMVEVEDRAECERLKAERKAKREALKDDLTERRYAGGDGYVNQSTAAMEHHQRRIEGLAKDIPFTPEAHEEIRLRRQADETTKRQQAKDEVLGRTGAEHSSSRDGIEMTDAKQAELSKSRGIDRDDRSIGRDHTDDDRSREAPGRGRTRSR